MKYTDPFLEEQKKLAGSPGGEELVGVNMPSLQTDKSKASQFIPSGDSLVAQIIAKKAQEAARSKQAQDSGYDPTGKTPEQIMAETGQQSTLDEIGKQAAFTPPPVLEQQIAQPTPQPVEKPIEQVMAETGRQSELDAMNQKDVAQPTPQVEPIIKQQELAVTPPTLPEQPLPSPQVEVVKAEPSAPVQTAEGWLPTEELTITQRFGNPNAALYGRSKSGAANINRGTDIKMDPGEPQAAPPDGKWVVEKAYKGDDFNTGWGRSVVIKNTETGETIRRSHLDKVLVNEGDDVTGKVLGTTGRTGRTTGYHADIEYTNPKGQLADYTRSPYFKYSRVQSGVQKQTTPIEEASVQTPQTPQASMSAQIMEQPTPMMNVEPVQMNNPLLELPTFFNQGKL